MELAHAARSAKAGPRDARLLTNRDLYLFVADLVRERGCYATLPPASPGTVKNAGGT